MDPAPNITYVVRLPTEPRKVSLDANDLGSRYKTRQLQVQQVGTTKMIRTYLLNVNDVAKDMQIPLQYIGYYLGYELSCVTKVDLKLPPREQVYISGGYDTQELSDLMAKFVAEVVACGVCTRPEVELSVEKKKKKIIGRCRACGSKKEKKFRNDKFVRYVLNHPPVSDGWSGNKAGGKEDRGNKGKGGKGRKGNKGGDDSPSNPPAKGAEDAAEDSNNANGKVDEDTAAPQEEELVDDELAKLAEAAAAKLAQGGEADAPAASTSDWATDTSEDAVAKRQEAFTPQSALDATKFLDNIRAAIKPDDIVGTTKALKALQTERELDDARFAEKIIESVMTVKPPCDALEALNDDLLMVLAEFAPEGAEKEQAAVLDGVEAWFTATGKEASAPQVIKHLYDEDAVEEDAIMLWWTRPSATKSMAVRESMQPMI